jgi:hypothetical protein
LTPCKIIFLSPKVAVSISGLHHLFMSSHFKSLLKVGILVLCYFIPSAHAQTWDLNDASYLFPLPTSSTDAEYVRAKGMVPFTWFTETLVDSSKMIFSLDLTLRNNSSPQQFRALATTNFNSIHLLAVRLDPCFKDVFSDVCRPQLRGVWQPFNKGFNTIDASMHTFYDLTPEEFQAVASQLQQLKSKYKISTAGLALQVHPGFKQRGFAKDLFSVFKNTMKPERISRIAFMQLLGAEFQWRFLSFDVKNGKLTPVQIPIHSGSQQTFAVHGGGIPPGTLELSEEDLRRITNGEGLDRVLLDYSLRVENPRNHIPGTTDCLSCHAIGGVKGAAAHSLGLNPIPNVGEQLALIGKYNLENTSKNRQDPLHFRAFGYVFREPSISDRVIMETALAADALNQSH